MKFVQKLEGSVGLSGLPNGGLIFAVFDFHTWECRFDVGERCR